MYRLENVHTSQIIDRIKGVLGVDVIQAEIGPALNPHRLGLPDSQQRREMARHFQDILKAPTTRQDKCRQVIVDYVTYFHLHFAYFVFLGIIGGACIYGFEGNASFLDCVFTAYSACCVTGLTVLDFSAFSVGAQTTVYFLIVLGSQVPMAVVPVIVRSFHYRRVLRSLSLDAEQDKEAQVEATALRYVCLLSLFCYLTIQVVTSLIFGFYLQFARGDLMAANDVNPWWFAVFHSSSAFGNAGFSLFRDSMIQLCDDYVMMLFTAFLILVGNTCWPILFRQVAILFLRCHPNDKGLTFLVEHPRRVYTLMFPRFHTRILLFCVIFFTLLQFVAFHALDYNVVAFEDYPAHIRSLIAYFQTVSTRAAGFNSFDIALCSPGMLWVFLIMMYISATPIIAGLRKATENDPDELGVISTTTSSRVRQALAANGVSLLLVVFILCVSEATLLSSVSVDIFSLMFEVSSAYGNVGLSLGFPGFVASLSGKFSAVGKLTVICVMLAGRHRGLPSAIDQSVSLEKIFNTKKLRTNNANEPHSPEKEEKKYEHDEAFEMSEQS